MPHLSRRFIAPLLIALCAGSVPATAQNSSQATAQNPSQTRYMRFGIGLPEDHPQGLVVKKFTELVSDKTQGRIKIELFAGGKLGNDVSMTPIRQRIWRRLDQKAVPAIGNQ